MYPHEAKNLVTKALLALKEDEFDTLQELQFEREGFQEQIDELEKRDHVISASEANETQRGLEREAASKIRGLKPVYEGDYDLNIQDITAMLEKDVTRLRLNSEHAESDLMLEIEKLDLQIQDIVARVMS